MSGPTLIMSTQIFTDFPDENPKSGQSTVWTKYRLQNGHSVKKIDLMYGYPPCKVNFHQTKPWTLDPGRTVSVYLSEKSSALEHHLAFEGRNTLQL